MTDTQRLIAAGWTAIAVVVIVAILRFGVDWSALSIFPELPRPPVN